MIAAGQLRRWKDNLPGGLFVVLRAEESRRGDGSPGWIIMEPARAPYWELASYIEKYSRVCNADDGVV